MIGTTLRPYDTNLSPDVTETKKDMRSEIRLISTVGIITIPASVRILGRYTLQKELVAEVKFEDCMYIVSDYLVDEYGIGDSLDEAREDLLESLVDYRESLARREDRLGNRERESLRLLRSLFG